MSTPNRNPMPRTALVLLVVPSALMLLACPGKETTPDAATGVDAAVGVDATVAPGPDAEVAGPDATVVTTDASVPDAGPVADLALLRAFSKDGTTVTATFSVALAAASVTSDAFRVDTPATEGVVAVTAAAVDGAVVTLTLASAMPKGPVYSLVGLEGLADEKGHVLNPAKAKVAIAGTLHYAAIWHQHQPVYVDPEGDYLRGPWVRKHGVKDYYDMTAMLEKYPDIHLMVNLTPVLLSQLQTYYLDRLSPYVDVSKGTIDTAGYFAQRASSPEQPISDPWLDMLLRDTPAPGAMSAKLVGWWYEGVWSNFSISDAMVARFPEYLALRKKKDAGTAFTQDELLQLKGWFELAWFDPDFLRGPVTLPTGAVVDLSDLVTEDAQGNFTLKAPFTEAICKRLVVEDYKVLAAIVGIHKKLAYDAEQKTGQVEVMTTPFYHPILPLVADTDLAKIAMPTATLPQHRFQEVDDARAHLAKTVKLYTDQFGRAPTGMWPAEGSVAQAVVPLFAEAGLKWIATDRGVLKASTPPNQPYTTPYRIHGLVGGQDKELAIVFRDTEISDKIGFAYQGQTPEQNVTDFLTSLRRYSPPYGTEQMLTVILDGENAWENYRFDNDAKGFLAGMYEALTKAQTAGEFRTVTVSEYLSGNAARGVAPHPTSGLPTLDTLWAGSWINGNYDTWIGEEEENLAWDYLWQTRQDLTSFNLTRPDPAAAPPTQGTQAWHIYKAWEAMYAAEGSDWFWWYGSDQTAVGGDAPFDQLYISLLKSVYTHAQAAGATVTVPDFPAILRVCTPPETLMSCAPAFDGAFVPDDGHSPAKANEWTQCGSGVCEDRDSGAVHNPNDVLGVVYHGVSATGVNVGLRMNENLATRLGTDFQIRLYFSQKHLATPVVQDPFLAKTRTGAAIAMTAGGAAREVTIDFSGTVPVAKLATVADTAWGAAAAETTITVGFATAASTDVLELGIPYAALNFLYSATPATMDPLEMLVTAGSSTAEFDRYPNANATVLFQDRSRMVEVTFILDATGTKLPLTAVKPIDNPPPPAGTGKAFIVGSLAELGNWKPNNVGMSDDGTTLGDATAADNFWTFRLLVPPLTAVNYKYTIGKVDDGWGASEEFPLTNRGFTVDDTDGDGKMVIVDVFADRPDPSGSMGARTTYPNP